MALVNQSDTVVFAKGCLSKRKAEKAIVEYLQKNEEFDGKQFCEACSYIGEKGRHLDLQVFEMEAKDFYDIQELALYAGHGEFLRIIFAPGNTEQAFNAAHKAFYLADKYQVPVIILTDQYLMDSYYNTDSFDQSKSISGIKKASIARSLSITGLKSLIIL